MGKIYLTHNPEEILKQYPKDSLKIFEAQEFKIADAKAAINEAYILDQNQKHIVLIGKIFNLEAQNSLLKILEEPPNGIEFSIFTQNKNVLLPTIRSRMQIINMIEKKPLSSIELDLKNLTLSKIYDFLKSLDSLSRIQSQDIIQGLLKTIHEQQIKLSQQELDLFHTAIYANLYHEKIHMTLLPILLSLTLKQNL